MGNNHPGSPIDNQPAAMEFVMSCADLPLFHWLIRCDQYEL
jgi:hypothetical protein